MTSILMATVIATLVTPPADTTRFGEVALSTGIRMHYAEQGEPRGEPVILLHGYSDSWFSFSRVLSPLSREAHVYALDMRGHGRSDKPDTGYGMSDLAADVIAFMDAKGIVRATVIGHSMGGLVAQQVALAAPKRVARLVLVGTAKSVNSFTGVAELQQAVASLGDPVPEAFVREFQVSTVHGNVPAAFIDRAVSESLLLPARVWHALMTGMLATEPALALGRSGIPVLVLRGGADAYVSGEATNALVSMVGARRQKTYANTGHAPHWEQPAAFARDVIAFRSDTGPGSR